MSETVKLIIEITKEHYESTKRLDKKYPYMLAGGEKAIAHGIPLDDVKAEIAEEICLTDNPYTKETKYTIDHLKLLEILDNIGKGDKE